MILVNTSFTYWI